MGKIVPESRKGAVDLRGLPTIMTMLANDCHAAVQAIAPGICRQVARGWFNRLRDQSTRYDISCRFDSSSHRQTMPLPARSVNPGQRYSFFACDLV